MVKPRQTFGDRSRTQVDVGCFSSFDITEIILEAGGKVLEYIKSGVDLLRREAMKLRGASVRANT